MLNQDEINLLDACSGKSVIQLVACNFKAYQKKPSISSYDSYLELHCGLKIVMENNFITIVRFERIISS